MPRRSQILDYVESALGEAAGRIGADDAVLQMLRDLPPRQFASPPDIWPYLPDLPVGG